MLMLSPAAVAADSRLPLGIRYTKQHPLVIVCDWNFAPYSFRDDYFLNDGFVIDVLEQIFNQIHVPYEIRMMEWKKAQRMLYSGTAQLMVDIAKNEETRSVRYGKSVVCNYPVAVARLKSTNPVRSIELLRQGDTVCVNRGDYVEKYLYGYFKGSPRFTVLPMPSHDAMTALVAGEIKYYVWSKESIRWEVRRFSLQDEIAIDDIDIPDGQFRFTSGDAQLLSEIDKQFERLRASDRYQPLVDKWLSGNDKYDEGTTALDILAIVGMIVLFVGSIIAMVFIMRGGSSGNLKREFKAIAHMSIGLTGCNVLAINVRRMWVYNVSGDFLPQKGLSMADYEALIHPDDIRIEYDVRKRVDEGERDMPVISFRMRKHNGPAADWHRLYVSAFIKANSKKHPAYVYLAMREETAPDAAQTTQPHDGADPAAGANAGISGIADVERKAAELIRSIDSLLGEKC